jgi:hypothetical protein
MRRAAAVLLLALVAVARDGWTQGGVPIGPEFRVNTYAFGTQRRPSVASDQDGNFVVVWESWDQQPSSSYGVFGQRFASSGAPLGPEFRVNTYTTGGSFNPSAAGIAGGDFVVVWTRSGGDVFGQRYNSSGAPVGSEFRVNTYTAGYQGEPAVASDAFGNFVFVWTSAGQDGANFGVFGQRYASSGVPLGAEFRVNTYTTGYQYRPAVASDLQGNFVVVWQDGNTYPEPGGGIPGRGVFGQRYDSSGAPVGPEFQVETYTTGFQGGPAVVVQPGGPFVVVWHSVYKTDTSWGVFGQRYSSSGAPVGSEFRVNTFTLGYQFGPALASDGAGNFVVTWSSPQDGSFYGVFGQRYDSAGVPQGSEFRVNTYTTSGQGAPAVASNGVGSFVVVWESDGGQDGALGGIFGQRYNQIVPVELMQFAVE